MSEHVKIKCKNENTYENIKDILGIAAIEYYQNGPGKALHLCDIKNKKEIEELLDTYGIKKYKIKTESPDFKTIRNEAENNYNQEDFDEELSL